MRGDFTVFTQICYNINKSKSQENGYFARELCCLGRLTRSQPDLNGTARRKSQHTEAKNMNEERMRKRLVRMTIVMVVVSFLLLACAGVIIGSIWNAQRSSYEAQLQATVTEHKLSLGREMSSNIRTLQTLSAFIENTPDLTFQDLAEGLPSSQSAANFIRMGYYAVEGEGIRVTFGGELELDVPYESLNPAIQQAIAQAWQGQASISEVYFSEDFDENTVGYAVPVYDKAGQTVGALIGLETLDTFQQLLETTTELDTRLDLSWINEEGEFLAWSGGQVGEQSNLFTADFLSEADIAAAQQAMQADQTYRCDITLYGQKYAFYFDPIGEHHWYLVCLDWSQGMDSPVYPFLVVTGLGLGAIVLLCILLIAYGYHTLYRNSRELIRLAYYDRLTGCYNLERFQQACTDTLSHGSGYSIVVLNIRRFQYINEIFGRSQADRLLCDIADILQDSLHQNECCSRYMGDQFYLLMQAVDPDRLKQRLLGIMGRISGIFEQTGRNYPIVLYAGAAIGTPSMAGEQAAKTLLHQAEFALKHVRDRHENMVAFYNDDMHAADAQQNNIESSMRYALSTGQFQMWLQPKMDLQTGVLCGAEALVRWVRPDGGMFYPNEFIPLFERNGFCTEFDLYMVERACACLRAWMDAGIQPVPISVNQSKLLFYQSDYVNKLCALTDQYGVPRTLIVLEILEGLAAENLDELNKTIEQLRACGFRLSLDDFGSGYSSLTILARLSIDEVKLDRSFLLGMSRQESDGQQKLLRNVVRLARDLGLRTVVEGIETAENAALVRAVGCDVGQGYYYSRPISVADFEAKYFSDKLPPKADL